MNPGINLSALSLARGAPGAGRAWSRFALPLLILLAFAGLAAWTMRDRFLTRHAVTTSPVVASGSVIVEDETVLFQAAGWVEPEPYPILVTPLISGVVSEVTVLEGRPVKAGNVIARLVDDDARIAVTMAQTELRLRRGERAAAEAALAAAQAEWDNPVDLRRDVAAAEAVEGRIEKELRQVDAALKESDADIAIRRFELDLAAEQVAKGLQSDRPRQAAELAWKKTLAMRETVAARSPILSAQLASAKVETAAARERLRLRIADRRRLDEARATLAQAQARIGSARAALEAAELQLKRTEVTAPCDAVVLSRSAVPGTRINLGSGEGHAAALVSLYDPDKLQMRVDVPLEHVGKVTADAKVRITVESVPGREFDGIVLRTTAMADIQKNTLQVKVRIVAPDRLLRPDMIGRIRFVAPPRAGDAGRKTVRLLVPKEAVEKTDGTASVWTVDALTQTAVRKTITLGPGRQGEMVEAVSGLTAADKVITGGRQGLVEGMRVRIEEEP